METELELPSHIFAVHDSGAVGPPSVTVERLNRALRGELSAVAAYDQVAQRFKGEPEAHRLLEMKLEHGDSVRCLRSIIRHEGAHPDDDSGVWGTVVKAVVGSHKLFGSAAALTALRRGEEFGLRIYENLVNDNLNLRAEDRDVIRLTLITRQQRHVALLDQLAQMH